MHIVKVGYQESKRSPDGAYVSVMLSVRLLTRMTVLASCRPIKNLPNVLLGELMAELQGGLAKVKPTYIYW